MFYLDKEMRVAARDAAVSQQMPMMTERLRLSLRKAELLRKMMLSCPKDGIPSQFR
ncbi:hypothetical protein [Nevskia sp.]|uniref:hypothetical protein n=1 Tax=Nevskia sp. TaxID=1929292 RepID=UPI0025E32F42|nr:hypothetical protein [Nevskia sp.]